MAELNIWKDHVWKDPELQIPVAFAPEAMEQIRRAAVDGMLSLRRVGVGVGGLLLGRYGNGKVTVLDSREIACAHNFGPSFRLTAEEVTAALAAIDGAEELRVVGVYCSKPRGPAEVNDDDRWLFESLCPERWQALLVVSPKSNNASTGAVFSRGAGRALLGGAQLHIEEKRASAPIEPATVVPAAVVPAAIDPVGLKPVAAVRAAVEPVAAVAPKVEPAPLVKPIVKPAPPIPRPIKPVAVPQPAILPDVIQEPQPPPLAGKAAPRPKAAPERVARLRSDVPLFSGTAPVKRAGLTPWMMWAGAAVLFVALCLGAFLTRDRWMPRPPLELRSYDSGGLLTVEWNRGAVRGIENGSLLFTDGTDTRNFILNELQLHSGWFRYGRKSGHVAVIFRAGPIQETTAYNDKPLAAPVAPQTSQPAASPPAKP